MNRKQRRAVLHSQLVVKRYIAQNSMYHAWEVALHHLSNLYGHKDL